MSSRRPSSVRPSPVVTVCPIYQDLRDTLFAKGRGLESNFDTFSDIDKLCFVMSNKDLVLVTVKTCNEFLLRRRHFISN